MNLMQRFNTFNLRFSFSVTTDLHSETNGGEFNTMY